jgi:hypothetical protein
MSCARETAIAAATSSSDAQRTIAAGRRSAVPFQTRRASS